MELILDASSRLFATHQYFLETKLCNELYPTGSGHLHLTDAAKLIDQIDHDVASSHLQRALQSEDQRSREHALWLCVDLRSQMQRGDRPALVAALDQRTESATGREKALAQLTLALCVPDPSRAAQRLAAIDTDDASELMMRAILYAAQERKLEIPRDQEVSWLATYLDKMPRELAWPEVYGPYDPTQIDYTGLALIDENPPLGPFRNVDWDRVDDALQADINAVVGPLLQSFEEQLAETADQKNAERPQQEASLKSRVLTQIIDRANLTGPTRDKAVELLNRRLEQLIRFRGQAAQQPPNDMDTPAEVAAAIFLLTGSVPESVKQGGRKETGYLAERLAETRETLMPQDGVIMMRGRRSGGGGFGLGAFDLAGGQGGRRGVSRPSLANWYPYELLGILHESFSEMRNAASRSPSRQRVGSLPEMLVWQVDPRLAIDYVVASGDDHFIAALGEFITAGEDPRSAPRYFMGNLGDLDRFNSEMLLLTQGILRHPQFAEAIAKRMEQSQSQATVEFIFKLWSTARSKEEAEAKLLDWLASGDATRTRAAMQELVTRDEARFSGEWAKAVSQAIDRIAEDPQLNSSDLFILDALGDQAPRAAEHATKYLIFWLDNPNERARQAELAGLWRGASALEPCVNILVRHPEEAAQISAKLAETFAEAEALEALQEEDRRQIHRLITFIEQMEETSRRSSLVPPRRRVAKSGSVGPSRPSVA